MLPRPRSILVTVPFATVLVAAAGPSSRTPITLSVDASDAPRRIFHAKMSFPVSAGPLTLLYPKWVPGEHGPTGPITDLAGLRISAGGAEIAWRRDDVNMYAFHLDVPRGASTLEVTLDYLSPIATEGFSSGASASAQLALVSWNQVLLYPREAKTDDLVYAASLRLPRGWKYGTALAVKGETEERIDFAPVSLTTLVDSPVLAGAHFRVYPLGEDEGRRHQVDVAADSEAALEMPPRWRTGLRQLVAETGALFGARHYRHYDFLLTLSDQVAHFGLEHHESSDDRAEERTFLDDEPRLLHAGLLPHEMVHSWNGKFRRPADLMPGSLDAPMRGDLLWVYEGLTTYLGNLLSARSGILTPDQYRDDLAEIAASLDHRAGRSWRPLADTAVAAQLLYEAPDAWASWRRSVDFYDEGDLIWLEADTVIRRRTSGARSLDDFCREFCGPPSGPPAVRTYTFDDVVAALERVAPHDWRGFLTGRLDSKSPRAPLHGVEASGWRVVYTDVIPQRQLAEEKLRKVVDVSYSLGLTLKEDTGHVIDALPGLPAYEAGIGPGMKVVAVNGRRFSKDVLREAIVAGTKGPASIELLVENGEYFRTHALDYHGGERYPHLERIEGTDDLLGEIIRPRAPRPAEPPGEKKAGG